MAHDPTHNLPPDQQSLRALDIIDAANLPRHQKLLAHTLLAVRQFLRELPEERRSLPKWTDDEIVAAAKQAIPGNENGPS